MNVFATYASLVMSFANLYRRERGPGKSVVAIACAMTGLLVGNLLSLYFFFAATRSRYLVYREIDRVPLLIIAFSLFLAELAFVTFVHREVGRSGPLATRVRAASPKIAVRYAVITAAAFVLSVIGMLIRNL
jgi:hypothetical protein